MVDHRLQAIIEIITKGGSELATPIKQLDMIEGLSGKVNASLAGLQRAFSNLGARVKVFTASLEASNVSLRQFRILSMSLMFSMLGLGFAFHTLASTVGAFVRPAIMEFAAMGDETSALTLGVTNMQIAVKGLMHEFAAFVAPTIEMLGRKFLEFREYVGGLDPELKKMIANGLLLATALGMVLSPLLFLLMPLFQMVTLGLQIAEAWGSIQAVMTALGVALQGVTIGGFVLLIAKIFILLAALKLIWDVVNAVFPNTLAKIGEVVGKIIGIFQILWAFIVDVFSLGMDLVMAIWEGRWGDIFEILGQIVGRIVRVIVDLALQIVDILVTAFEAALTAASEFIGLITDIITGDISLADAFSAIGQSIAGFGRGLGEGFSMPEAPNPAESTATKAPGAASLFFNIITTDPNFKIEEGGEELNTQFYSQWR